MSEAISNCSFCRKKKNLLISKSKFFYSKKLFFKSKMEISTFQDAGHNLNGAPDMAL